MWMWHRVVIEGRGARETKSSMPQARASAYMSQGTAYAATSQTADLASVPSSWIYFRRPSASA
jgi:hypothetical protein